MDAATIAGRAAGARKVARGYLARCPAHDDRRASLSIDDGAAGTIVHCFAGCETADVVAALGLQLADLFSNDGPRDEPAIVRRTEYVIADRDGKPVAVHIRHDEAAGKRFTWRQPDGTIGLNGTPTASLPLYRILEALEAPEAVVVVTEGEKAADSLGARGVTAVATVTGAAATPGDDVLVDLMGRDIVLWPDADDVGRSHMQRIAERLTDIGLVKSLRIIDWDSHKGADAADWPGDPWDLIDAAVPALPPFTAGPDMPSGIEPPLAGIARLVDISTEAPTPMMLGRLDPDGHTILFGTGGVGKGVLAAWWIVELGQPVLVIDFEDHASEWARRVGALGGRDALERTWHVAPASARYGGRHGALWDVADELREAADTLGITYVVVDSIIPACGAVDVMKPEAPSRYAAALVALQRPALSLAHVGRMEDGRYPFGSVFWHNLARTTWSAVRHGAPEAHQVLLAHKKHNNYAHVGRALVTVTWLAGQPGEVSEQPYNVAIADAIAEVLEATPQLTLAEIVAELNDPDVKADSVSKALRRGLADERFSVEGTGRNGRWSMR